MPEPLLDLVCDAHATGLLAERAAAEGGSGKFDAESMRQSQPQPEREFRVRGKLQEDESNLNLRLRICQPGGKAPCVCQRVLLDHAVITSSRLW